MEQWYVLSSILQAPQLLTLALNILLSRYASQYRNAAVGHGPIGVDHPAFKLTDLALMREFYKLEKVNKYLVQPGECVTIRRYRNRPRTIDECKFYDANNAAYLNHDLPGSKVHLWRITGTPQSAAGGSSTTLCDVKMAYVFSYHYKVSGVSYNKQTSYLPTALPTAVSVTQIYPGTSAAAAAAPVT